jgi:NAD(P)-dependent dehydrogenase (short-subunit alcohol dehydrogenase family)
MSRTYVISGAGSGIGLATKQKLESLGNRVIGIDIKGAEVIADLSESSGRKAAVSKVLDLAGGRIDAVIANAGSALPAPKTVSINYFGAVELISGLNSILKKSASPRVVATSSMATLLPSDSSLVAELLNGNEVSALKRAQELVDAKNGSEGMIYSSSKLALSRWIRRECIKADWAGAGIPLNSVAPGIVKTPMVAEMIATPEGREGLAKVVPMPLHGYLESENVADLIIWLASEANTHVTGQTIYIDGGSDAVIRGDNVWSAKPTQ